MPLFGAGGSSAGSTDAGYGSIDTAAIPSRDLLNNPFAPGKLDSRRIDPVSKDYVMGPNGTLLGMTRAQQAVELAFTTILGSSCVSTLGNDLKSIQVISDNFETEIKAKIEQALNNAVNQGLISILGIVVQRFGKNGAYIITRWRDLSTGQEQEKLING